MQKGFFGEFGGSFVPEALQKRLDELAAAYAKYKDDKDFQNEFKDLLKNYVGRPTPITECRNISKQLGGGRLFLKREDLNHTGAHKINNAIGQVLLAKRMGKTKLIAETGAGQHGVATATAAALFGMSCDIYMGAVDVERQAANVARMTLLGAKVVSVTQGQAVLKDAVDAALNAWCLDDTAFYLLGSAVGPHPYPTMVRDFQSVIGAEAKEQMKERVGRLPDEIVACIGGGSNAIGLFHEFVPEKDVAITGVEPAGKGLEPGKHAASLTMGQKSILHGFKSYVILNEKGEVGDVYSISAGLDYPSVGPEHAFLKDSGRAKYVTVTDKEALKAFTLLCKHEGIIPALESSHALAYAIKRLPQMKPDQILLVNLSGRGDKDMDQILNNHLLDHLDD